MTLLKVNKLWGVTNWIIFIRTSVWISSYTSSGGVALAKLYATVVDSSIDFKTTGIVFVLIINTIFLIILLFLRKKTYPFVSRFMQIVAVLSLITVVALFIDTIYRKGFDTQFLYALIDIKFSLPEGWNVADSKLVITAVIFAGLGGLWNVLYSVWLRQEGIGLAFENRSEFFEYKNSIDKISETEESINNYNKSMQLVKRDLWIGLSGNAMMMIIMIIYIAYSSFPKGMAAPTGFGVITSLGV